MKIPSRINKTDTRTSYTTQARKSPDTQARRKTLRIKKPQFGKGRFGPISLLLYNHKTDEASDVELLPGVFEAVKSQSSELGWTPLKLITHIIYDEIWGPYATTEGKVLGNETSKTQAPRNADAPVILSPGIEQGRGAQRAANVTVSNGAGAEVLTGAPFLRLESLVEKASALLRILSDRLGSQWSCGSMKGVELQASGLYSLADECAESLLTQWKAAHEATIRMVRGESTDCSSAATLVLSVQRTIILLKLLAAQNAESDAFDAEGEGRPPSSPSGYIILTKDVIAPLEQQFYAAFEAWEKLEAIVKQRAALLASAA